MFNSIYAEELTQYYELRTSILSNSAAMHERCYLQRFDAFLAGRQLSKSLLPEEVIIDWQKTVKGKSSSVENETIVIRQFLRYLQTAGTTVYLPTIPKVHDDYTPYIFSDDEINRIFLSADNVIQKDKKADPYLVIEFPIILRLLYSCGLRIGETVQLKTSDVDLNNGILRMINTKGDKHRLVPMTVLMNELLSKYCMIMGLTNDSDDWLFPSAFEGHLSDRAVKRRFAQILHDNQIQLYNRKKHERGPCLHCLRHVFAFKAFQKAEKSGKYLEDAIPYLSIYLGHESLNETSKYLNFSSELFPEAIDDYGTFMDDLLPEVDYEA